MSEEEEIAKALAKAPWSWNEEQIRGISIPPTTPRHPEEPERRELVPAGEEGDGTPEHHHIFPQYVNGWCTCVWIVWHPIARSAPLSVQSHLMQLSGGNALQAPSQSQVDRVIEEIRRANDVISQCDGMAFRVCDIILLNTSRVKWGPDGNKTSLSDLFSDSGLIKVGPGQVDFGKTLYEIMNGGEPRAFIEKMQKKCIHLFFVHDVEDVSDSNTEQGIGGTFSYGSGESSFALVDAKTTRPWQVIAHEIGHAAGEEVHSTTPGNIMQEEIDATDVDFDDEQCERMLAHLAKNIDPACP